jgi:LPXTG-motif cell wall-anchored protein
MHFSLKRRKITIAVLFTLSLALIGVSIFLAYKSRSQDTSSDASGTITVLRTITVCPLAGTGCDYVGINAIQEAIDAASSTATPTQATKIFVKNGPYKRSTITNTDSCNGVYHINKNIILEGESTNVMIDGADLPTGSDADGLCITGGVVSIDKITVNKFLSGIHIGKDAKADIKNSRITNNGGNGIIVLDTATVNIIGNTIIDSNLKNIDSSSISILTTTDIKSISNNIITNASSKTDAISVYSTAVIEKIDSNRISKSDPNPDDINQIAIDVGTVGSISSNIIENYEIGIRVYQTTVGLIFNNTMTNTDFGILLQRGAKVSSINANKITGAQSAISLMDDNTHANLITSNTFTNSTIAGINITAPAKVGKTSDNTYVNNKKNIIGVAQIDVNEDPLSNATPTPTNTSAPSASPTPSPTLTPTASVTPTPTRSTQASPTATNTPSPTATTTPVVNTSDDEDPTPSPTPSGTLPNTGVSSPLWIVVIGTMLTFVGLIVLINKPNIKQ